MPTKRKKTRGHLLVEIILLLVVIGGIAFFAVPNLMDNLNQSKQASATRDAENISIAAQAWLTEQEVAETALTLEEGGLLNAEDTQQILTLVGSIDKETAKTVQVTVQAADVPDCYQLKAVTLTKKGHEGNYPQ